MINNTILALQTRLLGVISNPYIDWDNDNDFVVPDLNTPYYKVDLVSGKNDSASIESVEMLGNGFLQVTLYFPINQGTIPRATKVDEIIAHFYGEKPVYGDVKVKILTPPYFTPLKNTADRYIGAITIPYTSNKI